MSSAPIQSLKSVEGSVEGRETEVYEKGTAQGKRQRVDIPDGRTKVAQRKMQRVADRQLAGTRHDGEDQEEDEIGAGGVRLPKRKVALLMGFCGTGFQGMQVNVNAKTIEGELFKALCEAGAVSKANADDMKKISLTRAARTDKGVHAAGQVVSFKMILADDIVDRINAALPNQIRVWGYVRTINSFNAKNLCDSRIYEYMLPTYVLGMKGIRNVVEDSMAVQLTDELRSFREEYRIDEDALGDARRILEAYVGTRNFHNYTVGQNFGDANSWRIIKSFTCSEPKVIGGIEWLSLKVHGQSFMLHQIRKMVAMMVLLIRNRSDFDAILKKSFTREKMNIPKAPGLGLLLERTVFDAYNRKQAPLGKDPVEFTTYTSEMDAFKAKYIYDRLVEEELQGGEFAGFIGLIEKHSSTFSYLVPEARAPALAPAQTLVEKEQ